MKSEGAAKTRHYAGPIKVMNVREVSAYLHVHPSTIYKPLKTFFAIGTVLMLAGLILGARFLWHFAAGDRAGHVQSLILAAVFLVTGFQTWLIALLAESSFPRGRASDNRAHRSFASRTSSMPAFLRSRFVAIVPFYRKGDSP